MEESFKSEGGANKGRKILLVVLLLFVALVTLAILAIKAYLASPYPAAELSRILSDSLKEEVRVARIESSGTTIYLRGVRILNPPGFPAGNLVYADSLAIAPDWRLFMTGKRYFRLIGLEGIRLNALQNRSGEWNFSRLQRHMAAQKPSPMETVIRHLAVKGGALSVNGRGVDGLSLDVFDLTSKGSRDSSLSLTFQDAWRNRYAVKGKARPGPTPSLALSLTADPFSLDPLVSLLPPDKRGRIRGGKGRLDFQGALEAGLFTGDGQLDFRDLRVAAAGHVIPLSGRLTLAGGYDQKSDQATLKSMVLALDHLTTVRGTGTVRKLRHEKAFAAELAMDEADLSRLAFLLPQQERATTRVGGKVSCRTVRVAGTGAGGLSVASGALVLRDGRLQREGRTFISGLDATVALQRAKGGIVATGRADGRAAEPALVERIKGDFQAAFSAKLKPLSARANIPAARASGTDFSARLRFDAASPAPYTVSAEVPAAGAAALNPLLSRYNLKLGSGTAAATLSGSGRSAADFAANVSCRLSGIDGSRGAQHFALRGGRVEGRLLRKEKHLESAGKAQLSSFWWGEKGDAWKVPSPRAGEGQGGGEGATTSADRSFTRPLSPSRQVRGDIGIETQTAKKGDAEFSYRVIDDAVTLENGTVKYGDHTASFATLLAQIPHKDGSGYPVSVEVKGGSLRSADVEAKGIAATLHGRYLSDPKGNWLEGDAVLSTGGASWKGKEVGAPSARLTFARNGGKGTLGGTLFGGALVADVAFRPMVPEEEEFTFSIAGAQVKGLSPFLPATKGPRLSSGVLDLRANGSYSRRAGINCRFQGKGKGIEVKDEKGKALLSDAGVTVQGALAGEKLSLAAAEISAGAGARLLAQGEVEKVFSPQRSGRLAFSVPRTSVNDLIDPFVSMMPRMLQEANTAGALSADGTMVLRDGQDLLEGSVALEEVTLEVPSQKVVLKGVNGKIPVSLELAGKEIGKPGAGLAVSRENYPKLLQQLKEKGTAGTPVTIAKVSYGTLDLGSVTMELQAESGLTEIRSLRATLYDGVVFGKGSVSMKKGGTFRVDLLANGVSLRSLCNDVPNIKGYISGRIDGFLSVTGTGGGLKGLVGYTEFWAREGKGEKMLVSREFLQRLSNQKLSGFFFSTDRPYDRAEIRALLQEGDLTFQALDIQHTNFIGVRDLSVSIVPTQNRIALDHLLESVRQAATRGKAATGAAPAETAPSTSPSPAPEAQPEFKWQD
ncbi:AsmA family protein [Geomonas sp. RF6]|uniref:AsmA family protein n=1 Tax=Geomonas sp. RF6 TaxID=2897342 RepID=UPI001E565A84|nr:AsmA family protein [Geomonas sp. RF6]UFS72563.1 AsmA family protein [Geomonas sp. RF6]